MNIKKNITSSLRTTIAAAASLLLLIAGWIDILPFVIPEPFQYALGAIAVVGWILPDKLSELISKRVDKKIDED